MLDFLPTLIFIIGIIYLIMLGFFKFMYPKPPNHYYPKESDNQTPRKCDHCGHFLEEYRGILEPKTEPKTDSKNPNHAQSSVQSQNELSKADINPNAESWFFCNADHQADFHAGKPYRYDEEA